MSRSQLKGGTRRQKPPDDKQRHHATLEQRASRYLWGGKQASAPENSDVKRASPGDGSGKCCEGCSSSTHNEPKAFTIKQILTNIKHIYFRKLRFISDTGKNKVLQRRAT